MPYVRANPGLCLSRTCGQSPGPHGDRGALCRDAAEACDPSGNLLAGTPAYAMPPHHSATIFAMAPHHSATIIAMAPHHSATFLVMSPHRSATFSGLFGLPFWPLKRFWLVDLPFRPALLALLANLLGPPFWHSMPTVFASIRRSQENVPSPPEAQPCKTAGATRECNWKR